MSPRPRWSRREIAHLFELRDVQKLPWKDIGERLGRLDTVCCTRYNYFKGKKRVEAIRARVLAEAIIPPDDRPLIVTENPPRPRYVHHTDAEILARIAAQGVTAGFLGDPPPGRSALDEKRSASA